MLQLYKNQVVTNVAKQQVEIRQLELDWYTSNYWTLSQQAALLAGFAFAQLTTPLPRGTTYAIESLYLVLATTAMGMQLFVVVTTTFCCMWGPGLALRGPHGTQSVHLALDNLRKEQTHVFAFFMAGLIAFFLDNILLIWCYFAVNTASYRSTTATGTAATSSGALKEGGGGGLTGDTEGKHQQGGAATAGSNFIVIVATALLGGFLVLIIYYSIRLTSELRVGDDEAVLGRIEALQAYEVIGDLDEQYTGDPKTASSGSNARRIEGRRWNRSGVYHEDGGLSQEPFGRIEESFFPVCSDEGYVMYDNIGRSITGDTVGGEEGNRTVGGTGRYCGGGGGLGYQRPSSRRGRSRMADVADMLSFIVRWAVGPESPTQTAMASVSNRREPPPRGREHPAGNVPANLLRQTHQQPWLNRAEENFNSDDSFQNESTRREEEQASAEEERASRPQQCKERDLEDSEKNDAAYTTVLSAQR